MVDLAVLSHENKYVLMVSASYDKSVRLWKLSPEKNLWSCEHVLKGHEGMVRTVAISRDAERDSFVVVSGSSDSTIRVWNSDETKKIVVLRGHENWINEVVVFQSKKYGGFCVLSGSNDKTLRFWNVMQKSCIFVFPFESEVNCLCVRMKVSSDLDNEEENGSVGAEFFVSVGLESGVMPMLCG